jgi:hypothetical protein
LILRFGMVNLKTLSNRQLINRINSRFKNNQNDDDEVAEMVRRRDAGKLKFKAGFRDYELID